MEWQLRTMYEASERCQRVAAVERIGPVTAMSDGKTFENGRQLAAWLGPVPRQHCSGGKTRLFGISKRGDPYLRALLIHDARSVVYRASRETDSRSRWIADRQRRLGPSKA
jgi:transposase